MAGSRRTVAAGPPLAAAALSVFSLSLTPVMPLNAQAALSVDGVVESTVGGFRLPDGTLQATSTATRAPVHRTGQTGCISGGLPGGGVCDDTGEDGEIQAGVVWPIPRFTDHGDGTITDNLTGLMWLKDANCQEVDMTWQGALDWIESLNDTPIPCEDYAPLTYTDWRMSNANELSSLLKRGVTDPSLPDDHPFVDFFSTPQYWTSTTDAEDPDEAFTVRFVVGTNVGIPKSESKRFLPVRGGLVETAPVALPLGDTGLTTCFDTSGSERPCAGTGEDGEHRAGLAWPTPRFVDHGDGTVTDNLTGHSWLKDANCPGMEVEWDDALAWVSSLNNDAIACADYIPMTYDDWRLPNVNELLSLTDFSRSHPPLPAGHPFLDVQSGTFDGYWSSTSRFPNFGEVWYVRMSNAGAGATSFGQTFSVWPVRGGL